ncbi:CLUMA_CG005353, isoform A [Clunio marinus]|uniref:Poly [ADP-ribose] polymerase n=1 Tax=Clunio marinus TaxID=568069 RepID=A0A1J1HUN0_9DIPT|nr:CLUMA_CG005353, isoform A [Clunio marinus]
MEDLPYKIEYAKTGRAGCRKCKCKIDQGELRIAAMIQSFHHDGKDPHWFHSSCFFEKHRPKTVDDIDHFESIRYEDQEIVRKNIGKLNEILLPETSSKKKGKAGKKRAAENIENNIVLKDFGIEYSRSSRAACVGCQNKIMVDDIRIKRTVYDTEVGAKFGGQPLWHHLDCFVSIRGDYGYYLGGESLPGFSDLSAPDRKKVKSALQAITIDETMAKKLKGEPKDEVDEAMDGLEEEMKKQNKKLYKVRDKLQELCTKSQLQDILFKNGSGMVEGKDGLLDRCADFLTFGAVSKCEKCMKGDLIFTKGGYRCNGKSDEWLECGNFVEKPKRTKSKIPSSLTGKNNDEFFTKYRSKIEDRAIKPYVKKPKKEETSTKAKVEREREPLYGMHFVVVGKLSKEKNDLTYLVKTLGGKISASVHDKIAAIISNVDEVSKMSSKIKKAKELDVQVVPVEFLDAVKGGKRTETFEKIKTMSICSWGSDPMTRIPQEEVNEVKESLYTKNTKKVANMVVKNGAAVDPQSGVDDIAHVYRFDNVLYTSVLSLTDISKNKNSYYKVQVLEADKGGRYWLFRAWGRIGTKIGEHKLESFPSASSACERFEGLFEEKTGNTFGSKSFVKKHGLYYPVEVDYDDGSKAAKVNELSKIPSKLPKPTQDLINMLFDVNLMKQTMMEFELDLEKMPLGRLSKKQLHDAYQTLKDLNDLVVRGAGSEEFVGLSNKFFTLVPHNFGMERAPVIDTLEMIQNKREILDNLIEVEIAYSMLQEQSDEKINPIDAHYGQLKTEMKPIDHKSDEFKLINDYVQNTHAETHNAYALEVMDVFKVNRQGESRRYKPFKKLHNRQLLWHGSRLTNYVGILSHGLKIAPPEAPVTGYMFGKGIYFADMVSKSANYCCTNSSNDVGLMLLSEVALGDSLELTRSSYVESLPSGKHSTKGMGTTFPDPQQAHTRSDGVVVPMGKPVTDKKLQSSLLYNEYIVYEVAQVNVQYLLKMKFNYNKRRR